MAKEKRRLVMDEPGKAHRETAMTIEMLTALFESAFQAPHDFGGEQREWHVPRLNRAAALAMQLFGVAAYRAMEQAKTPYGEPLLRD